MFIGRERELGLLEEAYESGRFQMAIVYGRRRVGKTALLHEFARGKTHVVYFTARQTLVRENLEGLSRAMMAGLDETGGSRAASDEPGLIAAPSGSGPVYPSFSDALEVLFLRARSDRIVLVIDEYPYLAETYKSISSLLQSLIDGNKDTSRMMLVLCGSSMSFMEHQVLGEKSPLYGRRTMQIKVEPFDVFDVARMLGDDDPDRVVEFYSMVGGVPQYVEQLDATRDLEWNVANRLLRSGSFLSAEPENYLMQEVRNPASYNAVLAAVAQGCVRPIEVADRTGIAAPLVSQYLGRLEELGIVRRVVPLPTGNKRQVRYEVSDNLMNFHFRYAVRYETAIEAGMVDQVAARVLGRDFPAYVGHTFEAVCRQWLLRQMRAGKIDMLPRAVGTWWGSGRDGRQEEIDVVAVGADDELLLGECKWNRSEVDASVLGVLKRRAALVAGGADAQLYVFSRAGFERELVERAASDSRVRLVSLGEMFE